MEKDDGKGIVCLVLKVWPLALFCSCHLSSPWLPLGGTGTPVSHPLADGHYCIGLTSLLCMLGTDKRFREVHQIAIRETSISLHQVRRSCLFIRVFSRTTPKAMTEPHRDWLYYRLSLLCFLRIPFS